MKRLNGLTLEVAIETLKQRFFTRTDAVAVLAPWDRPCPVAVTPELLDKLLQTHVHPASKPVTVKLQTKQKDSKEKSGYRTEEVQTSGRFRVGAYCLDKSEKVKWLCIDIDGGGHAYAVKDPQSIALMIFRSLSKLGLNPLLEKSGSGKGWHVWILFDEPVEAEKARAIGFQVTLDIGATCENGKQTDPRKAQGIEVFPKQDKLRKDGFGNLVWLPFWFEGKNGGCSFYQPKPDGKGLELAETLAIVPATASQLDDLIRTLANTEGGSSILASAKGGNAQGKARKGLAVKDWTGWRKQALEALPIESVFGPWLTGRESGPGWLECRDPASSSGDRKPSAGVGDGTNGTEKGQFHSHRDGRTESIFDFMVSNGIAPDFNQARAKVAELSGVPLPVETVKQPKQTRIPTGGNAGGNGGNADANDNGDGTPFAAPGIYKLTDFGNACRFRDRYRDSLRYCPESARWMIWNGKFWESANGSQVELAGRIALAIENETDLVEGDNEAATAFRLAIQRHSNKSQDGAKISAMVKIAQGMRELRASINDFDRASWLLNVGNGTIDLRTGKLREHRKDDLITQITNVNFDESATCPEWQAFIKKIMLDRDDMVSYLQRIFGYCLTGVISEQALFVFYGTGSNGKSTCVDTFYEFMGGYATIAAPGIFIKDKSNAEQHPTGIADLRGRRVAISSELESGKHLNVEVVKRITGDVSLKGRFMRQDFFEFPSTFKPILIGNAFPRVNSDDEGTWRRIHVIPFEAFFSDAERKDKDAIHATFRSEFSGILNWLIAGCLEWQRLHLSPPIASKDAKHEYRINEDSFGEFIEECCTIEEPDRNRRRWNKNSSVKVGTKELYSRYVSWCEKFNVKPIGKIGFGDKLREKGFCRGGDRSMFWIGIDLRNEDSTNEIGEQTIADLDRAW